ncbi:MAG: DUF3135 domain-containing protein [Gammaproteobacteria bacterium]|nr:DUF3135 domain-containing protein [Gammaproteobacteria bacterium]
MDEKTTDKGETPTAEAFDFDGWLNLARRDPDALEKRRRREIKRLISQAPVELRPRLEGLQWQIDIIRDRADTPLGACVEISEMMWDQILGPNGLVTSLCTLSDEEQTEPRESAAIIAFPTRSDIPSL